MVILGNGADIVKLTRSNYQKILKIEPSKTKQDFYQKSIILQIDSISLFDVSNCNTSAGFNWISSKHYRRIVNDYYLNLVFEISTINKGLSDTSVLPNMRMDSLDASLFCKKDPMLYFKLNNEGFWNFHRSNRLTNSLILRNVLNKVPMLYEYNDEGYMIFATLLKNGEVGGVFALKIGLIKNWIKSGSLILKSVKFSNSIQIFANAFGISPFYDVYFISNFSVKDRVSFFTLEKIQTNSSLIRRLLKSKE